MEQVILKTNHLTKRYGHRAVVENLSMTIYKGDIYGFIGKNGAGKTTLIRMVTGLATPSDGSIRLFGSGSLLEGRRRIGTVIEAPAFYPGMTAYENIIAFSKLQGLHDFSHAEYLLELVGLSHTGKKKCRNFSLGMKQRLGIANAILHDPELLILDEPTNGLDPIGIAEVRNFIKDLSEDRGKTILISSHILSEIALLADDIGIIDHGVLLEESSMEDLEKKNRKYIQLQVSDVPKASLILERQFHVTDYAVQDEHSLRLYDTALDMAAINKALVVQDVAVISSQICNDTLEDYFKQITGGEGIA